MIWPRWSITVVCMTINHVSLISPRVDRVQLARTQRADRVSNPGETSADGLFAANDPRRARVYWETDIRDCSDSLTRHRLWWTRTPSTSIGGLREMNGSSECTSRRINVPASCWWRWKWATGAKGTAGWMRKGRREEKRRGNGHIGDLSSARHNAWLDSFYVRVSTMTATWTVGHSLRSTLIIGHRFTALGLPWRSPIQVLTEVDFA